MVGSEEVACVRAGGGLGAHLGGSRTHNGVQGSRSLAEDAGEGHGGQVHQEALCGAGAIVWSAAPLMALHTLQNPLPSPHLHPLSRGLRQSPGNQKTCVEPGVCRNVPAILGLHPLAGHGGASPASVQVTSFLHLPAPQIREETASHL